MLRSWTATPGLHRGVVSSQDEAEIGPGRVPTHPQALTGGTRGRSSADRAPRFRVAVFGKLVEVLVFGCANWRIADESCSESTLRSRRNEWIERGVMEKLREIALEAYDRLIGLEMADLSWTDA